MKPFLYLRSRWPPSQRRRHRTLLTAWTSGEFTLLILLPILTNRRALTISTLSNFRKELKYKYKKLKTELRSKEKSLSGKRLRILLILIDSAVLLGEKSKRVSYLEAKANYLEKLA